MSLLKKEDCVKLREEIEELKKDKVILAGQIALKDQQIQRLWKEIDELKREKIENYRPFAKMF
jgi:hypothetical protein